MLTSARFNGCIGRIQVAFVERVATPIPIMKVGIHLHLGRLSLSNTISVLESLGYERARSTVHNWIQKADLAPDAGRDPDRIALNETVVKVNVERYWLYMAVNPETNDILHLRLFPSRTTVLTKRFLRELADNHAVEEAEFLVDGAPWLHAGLVELGMHFRHETFGERNPVERIFQDIKRRTNQFYNTFSHAEPATAEHWLQALARARGLIREELDAAYHEVPGNHDVETLGLAEFVADGRTFPCTVTFTDGVTGVFIDTTLPEWPHVPGALGVAQIDALASILTEADAAVIFSHHPLHAHDQTGGWFEGYPELAYPRDRYWAHEHIQEAGNVRALVNGHTHLETMHAFEGIPSFTVGAFNRERPGREAVTCSFAIMEISADHVGYHSFKDGSSHGTTTFS